MIAAVAVIAQGFDLEERWQWTAVGAGVAALLLLAPVLLLDRSSLEAPIRRTERTALLRGAAVCATLGGALLLAGEVLAAAGAVARRMRSITRSRPPGPRAAAPCRGARDRGGC